MSPLPVARATAVLQMSKVAVLRAIKDAETAASETLASAREQAIQLLQDARQDAADIVRRAQADGQTAARALVDTARAAAQVEAAELNAAGAGDINAIHEAAHARRESAVAAILQAFSTV